MKKRGNTDVERRSDEKSESDKRRQARRSRDVRVMKLMKELIEMKANNTKENKG